MLFRNKHFHRGFTVLELLIVIAIIGILSSFLFISYQGHREKAKLSNTMQWAKSIHSELGAYAVGGWSFDVISGNTVLDDSGNGNNGTIYGATQVDGIIDKALSFDGVDDYVLIPSIPNLKPSNITISLWVKTNEDTSVESWNGIILGAYGGGYSNGWRILDHLNRPLFQMNFGDANPRSYYGDILGVGKWVHIVATYDHQYMRLYQNGKQVGTPLAETRDINWSASGDLRIGFAQSYFNGSIDDVRIYKEPFTQAQIQQLYAQGLKIHQNLAKLEKSENLP